MALYLVVGRLWIGSPVEIVWISSDLGGHYKRAIGSAIRVSTALLLWQMCLQSVVSGCTG